MGGPEAMIKTTGNESIHPDEAANEPSDGESTGTWMRDLATDRTKSTAIFRELGIVITEERAAGPRDPPRSGDRAHVDLSIFLFDPVVGWETDVGTYNWNRRSRDPDWVDISEEDLRESQVDEVIACYAEATTFKSRLLSEIDKLNDHGHLVDWELATYGPPAPAAHDHGEDGDSEGDLSQQNSRHTKRSLDGSLPGSLHIRALRNNLRQWRLFYEGKPGRGEATWHHPPLAALASWEDVPEGHGVPHGY